MLLLRAHGQRLDVLDRCGSSAVYSGRSRVVWGRPGGTYQAHEGTDFIIVPYVPGVLQLSDEAGNNTCPSEAFPPSKFRLKLRHHMIRCLVSLGYIAIMATTLRGLKDLLRVLPPMATGLSMSEIAIVVDTKFIQGYSQ